MQAALSRIAHRGAAGMIEGLPQGFVAILLCYNKSKGQEGGSEGPPKLSMRLAVYKV